MAAVWIGSFCNSRNRSSLHIRPTGAITAALSSIGIPHNSIVQYETAVKSSKLLVIEHGTADEMAKAKSILNTAGAEQAEVHQGIRD